MDLVFHETERQKQVTSLAHALLKFPQVESPVKNHFFPGLYAREIFMGKGLFLISEIHKTEHPFVILSGVVDVWTQETGKQRFHAPYFGRTMPNTRRMLLIIEDCTWITFHATELKTVDEIRQAIIVPFETLPESEIPLTIESFLIL